MAGTKFSIAYRIIIATIVLILLLLAGFGFLSLKRLESVYLKTGKDQTESYIDNLKFAGRAQLFTLNKLAAKFLKASEFNELATAIPPIGREDKKIDTIIVTDERGNLISYYNFNYPKARVLKEDKTYLIGDRNLGGKKEVTFTGFPWSEVLIKAGDARGVIPKVKKPKQEGLPAGMDIISTIPEDKQRILCQDDQERMIYVSPIVEEGTYLGNIIMLYNLRSLKIYEEKLKSSLKKDKADSLKKIVIFGAILLLLGFLFAIFQGLRITRPVKSLVRSFETFAQGDLGHRVSIHTNDEIQVLGEGFNFMADNLVILLQETEKKAVMAKELEVARTIQETLVPPNDLMTFPKMDVIGYFVPASETGGDWWYHYKLSNERYLIIIGDVTGHGVPAAMITAAAKSACDTILTMESLVPNLSTFMEILNKVIHQNGKGQFFMTCFACIFDPASLQLTFVNAGHNFPYVYRKTEDKFIQLMVRGNRLGEPDQGPYEIKEVTLEPEDLVVWYTDGIIEDENPEAVEYGDKRFRRIIKKFCDLPLNELRDSLVKDAEEFYSGVAHQDDHTLVFGRIKKA
ncbi:SpoIIE family protein phosphatase [Myxococcota bacterium]|nr:SpoIIE family protein phosphatase [Myxococcota bacterium]